MTKKLTIRAMLIFVGMVILGLLLIIVSGHLPHVPIHQHIIESSQIFGDEGALTERIPGYKGTIVDDNTDAWMLLIADYNDNSNGELELAFGGHYYVYTEPVSGFIGMDNIGLVGSEKPIEVGSYTRYWHGWLFPLRLLLCFFNYAELRIFNLIVVALLILGVVLTMFKRNANELIIPYLVSVLFLFPYTISQCMAYMISFIISMVSVLVILNHWDSIESRIGMPVFFMIVGAITAYSEFLQFPLLTLGLPLVVCIYTKLDKKDVSTCISKVLIYAFMWALGYLGMWIAKWGLATLLTSADVFSEAVREVKLRSSDTGNMETMERINRLAAVIVCLPPIRKLPFTIVLVVGIVYSCIRIVRYGLSSWLSEHVSLVFPYLVVAFIPVVWALAFANHSYTHSHFTFRIFVISLFAALAWLSQTGQKNSK